MTPEPTTLAEELIEQAKNASRNDRWEESLSLYDRASSLPGLLHTPEGTCQWARIQINRGVIFHRLGRMPQARDSWMAALRPTEVPGLAYLQCIASGYMLGLSERTRPEWNQGWKQVLHRYAGHGDVRIPPRLFEFFFGREWEFDGLRPGLDSFFRVMAGLWDRVEAPQREEAAWVYHSLPQEDKFRVLPFWGEAPFQWAQILWGKSGGWQVFEPEAQWLRSRGYPGISDLLPASWTPGAGQSKLPEAASYKCSRPGVRLMGSGHPPWTLFDDGSLAQGSSIKPSEGTFLDFSARGETWVGIRKIKPGEVVVGCRGEETRFLLPEEGKLTALDSRGLWYAWGISGQFYSGTGGPVPLDAPVRTGPHKKFFAFRSGLALWSEDGPLVYRGELGEWEVKTFGTDQVIWADVHPLKDWLALGKGAWTEVWNLESSSPVLVSKSPEPWDQGGWGRDGLGVWNSKSWGTFSLDTREWSRQASPTVLHSLWMLEEGPAFSDRKGRWRLASGPWHQAHGNWVNGLVPDPRGGYWTGDLDGQLVRWTSRGQVEGSWGPEPVLSAEWLGDGGFLTLHPGYLKFWMQGRETALTAHPASVTVLRVRDAQAWVGDGEGRVTVLDRQGGILNSLDPGLGGITALASGSGGMGLGGSDRGWGVLDSGGTWTKWGEEGITALHFWKDGWVTGHRSGELKFWKEPGKGQHWPEVHRDQVMSLVQQTGELFSAGADGRVLGWTGEGQLSQILRREKSPVWDLKPAGRVLLGRTEDRDLNVWNLPGTGGFWKGEGHRLPLSSLDVHPTRAFCATGGTEGWVRIWSLPGIIPLSRFDLGQPIAAVRFSPGGRQLLAVTNKGAWKIWDLETLLPRPAE